MVSRRRGEIPLGPPSGAGSGGYRSDVASSGIPRPWWDVAHRLFVIACQDYVVVQGEVDLLIAKAISGPEMTAGYCTSRMTRRYSLLKFTPSRPPAGVGSWVIERCRIAAILCFSSGRASRRARPTEPSLPFISISVDLDVQEPLQRSHLHNLCSVPSKL